MWCPSCSSEVEPSAILCVNCKADFSNPQGWKPVPALGKQVKKNKQSAANKSDQLIDAKQTSAPSKSNFALGCLFAILLIFGFFSLFIFYAAISFTAH
jgi:hypothetical protein